MYKGLSIDWIHVLKFSKKACLLFLETDSL